jgi:hypothetical protein
MERSTTMGSGLSADALITLNYIVQEVDPEVWLGADTNPWSTVLTLVRLLRNDSGAGIFD